MVRRASNSKGVDTAAKTSASKARTVRANKTDGTSVDQPKVRRNVVSGKTPSTVGQKGNSRTATSKAVKSGVSYSSSGHSGGYQLGSAPKLGRTGSAVSGVPGGSYGTAKAKNTGRSNSDHGKAVSGLDSSFGTAPAKNRSSEAYGTAPARGSHHEGG